MAPETYLPACAAGMGVGALGGAAIARRMAITELPQMVAAFHSLVGLAAVATSIASFMAHPDLSDPIHVTSSFLGTLIGAVTLTGAGTRPELHSPSCHPEQEIEPLRRQP